MLDTKCSFYQCKQTLHLFFIFFLLFKITNTRSDEMYNFFWTKMKVKKVFKTMSDALLTHMFDNSSNVGFY